MGNFFVLDPSQYIPKMKEGYAYRVPNTNEYVENMSSIQFQMEGPFNPFSVPEHRSLMDVLIATNHLRILITMIFNQDSLESFRKFYDYVLHRYIHGMKNFQLEIVKVIDYKEVNRLVLQTVKAESVSVLKPIGQRGNNGEVQFLFWIKGRAFVSPQGTIGNIDRLGDQRQ